MRLRDLLGSGVGLAVAVVHFGLQYYGWQVHVGAVLPQSDPFGGSVWGICSLPLFAIISRRLQTLYFLQLLVANSLTWGVIAAWSTSTVLHRVMRPRPRVRLRAVPPASPPTERLNADRLVELKRLRDQGMISREEFLEKRAGILTRI